MTKGYFSDREGTAPPRIAETIAERPWHAIGAEIDARIENGSFGLAFPLGCPDGGGPIGTDRRGFFAARDGHVPALATQFHWETPPTLAILDLIEFCYRLVAKPRRGAYHRGLQHHHLEFDEEEGRAEFRKNINLILARNGLVYELQPNGEVVRVAPPVLREALTVAKFNTGDTALDSLLGDAISKYLDPDPKLRKESLEKLWDAWERVKTVEPGDKKASTKALLDRAAPERALRQFIEKHADAATYAGNKLMIRHTEKDQEQVERSEVIEYLFLQLFALISFVLAATGRSK